MFRFFIYSETPVRRSLNYSNTIYVVIMVLLYAIFINVTSMLIWNFVTKLIRHCFGWDYVVKIKEAGSNISLHIAGVDHTYFGFIDKYPVLSIAYSIWSLVIAYALAKLVLALSERWMPLGRVMYGPLAPLLSSRHDELFTCHVLTKVQEKNRRVMYQGFPVEVILKNGSNIDHIVIKNPEKFYMKINSQGNAPTTTRESSVSIGDGVLNGLIYISGNDIENVYFESWYF